MNFSFLSEKNVSSHVAFIDYAKYFRHKHFLCVHQRTRRHRRPPPTHTHRRSFIYLCIFRNMTPMHTHNLVYVCVSVLLLFFFTFLKVCVMWQDWRIDTHAGEYVHNETSLETCCSASFQFYTLTLCPMLFTLFSSRSLPSDFFWFFS